MQPVTGVRRDPAAWPPGLWLGAAAGALGWALSALVLARGGGYLVVVPHLAVALPLAVVGTVTALACSAVGRPAVGPVTWLAVVAAAGAAWNFLVYWFRFGAETWALLIPLRKPGGLDFRDGLYEPALAFTTARSGWPPLTLILGKPFTLLGFPAARALEVGLLVVAAAASVVLGALLAVHAEGGPGGSGGRGASMPSGSGPDAGPLALGLVSALWLATSAGFMYELERGNIDLFALLFSLLGVWLLLRPEPRSPWWPALALAVAVNLKLYPGVLLVLPLWRYRLRAVVPVLVTNLALLFIAGPGNVADTVRGQVAVESVAKAYWWGNHSAASLARVLRGLSGAWPSWIYWPLLVVPLALWLVTMVLLVRRGWSARRAVLAAAACFPLMSVVPGISHDYKLVICVFPLAVVAAALATMRERGTLVWALLFGALSWAMIQLSRASLVTAPSLQNSKYLMVVVLQALLLAVVALTENGSGGETDPAALNGVAPHGAAEEETT